MQLTKEVQERLEQAIATRGFSHYKIAKELKISATTISNYLTGKIKKPDNTKLEAICHLLGINMEWLLTGRHMVCINTDKEKSPEKDSVEYKFEKILMMLQTKNDQYQNLHKDMEYFQKFMDKIQADIIEIKESLKKQ